MKPVDLIGVSSRMNQRDRKRLPLSHQDVADARARSRQIGKLLHLAFDKVAREPVPSEFLELLEELDDRDRPRNGAAATR
ncbi:MAG: hypothetical protein GC190_15410 [Alphaproteobacteria bacterium]|nr:hypothetical protein [Alphaproteobacteria bacterium]